MRYVLSVTLVSILFASTAHAEEAPRVPHVKEDGQPALAIAGESVLAASWIVSSGFVFGTTTCSGSFINFGGNDNGIRCHSFSGWLFVPVIGPGIALADNATKPTPMSGEIAYYATTTALNVAALASIIVGYVTRPSPNPRNVRFSPAFQASSNGGSLGLSGTF
jgi:hypothetical protein